jgi:hypothetical protein
MTAELSPVIRDAIAFLRRKPEATLDELAEQVYPAPAPAPAAEAVPFPALPEAKALGDAQQDALHELPRVFGLVAMKERRELSRAELRALEHETEILKTIKTMAAAREEAVKTLVRTSIDVQAEREGIAFPADTPGHAATPRDQHGHYLLAAQGEPYKLRAESHEWSQQYTSGRALPVEGTLGDLAEKGEIEREEYLAFTEAKRVFSREKALRFIARNPARGMAILRSITTRTAPGSTLTFRKAK